MAVRPTMIMLSSRLHAGAKALPAALALAAMAAAPASAAAPSPSPVAFALSPVGTTGSMTLSGTPGGVLDSAVNVRNLTSRRITVVLQRADIENASNGGADYVTTRLHSAGLWLALGTGTVRLAPYASRRIAFTVHIPRLATGASHYAGIVAINAADLGTHASRIKSKAPTFTFFRISRQALPLTVHLPGRLSRSLSLRYAKLIAEPIGAGLVLGLLPGGSELTQGARLELRVLRGARTILTYASTLGQLFPGAGLDYRIPWPGHPTPGPYHLLGTISPQGSASISIDQTIEYSAAKASRLASETPPVAHASTSSAPGWIWIVLAVGAAILIALSLVIFNLLRRSRTALA